VFLRDGTQFLYFARTKADENRAIYSWPSSATSRSWRLLREPAK
jgi:hypothetical protein